MLKKITYGTFYFFFGFTTILFVWVWLWLPETRGVPIEEMDRIWGGHEAHENVMKMDLIIKDLQMQGSVGGFDDTYAYQGKIKMLPSPEEFEISELALQS